MTKNTKITYEGQPCRKCETPVVKRSHNKPSKPSAKHWFKYWFVCPNCNTIYMVNSARVSSSPKQNRPRVAKRDKKIKRTRENSTRVYVNYYQYINSLEWLRKSEEAKKRAGYRCQVCNFSHFETVLHTHHRTYERLGREEEQDLIVLCKECHQIFHENRRIESQKHKPITRRMNDFG